MRAATLLPLRSSSFINRTERNGKLRGDAFEYPQHY